MVHARPAIAHGHHAQDVAAGGQARLREDSLLILLALGVVEAHATLEHVIQIHVGLASPGVAVGEECHRGAGAGRGGAMSMKSRVAVLALRRKEPAGTVDAAR
ncbi:hypothetical protein F0U60_15665 [Archangium minus]|uniref:Uncharacterized protein n=1 Tax=Archangium minus TaxID=83450 RepID=A0ABY9WQE8_9BACT|nr:hypothetical protein F0U60_15665 [Archangium minus]